MPSKRQEFFLPLLLQKKQHIYYYFASYNVNSQMTKAEEHKQIDVVREDLIVSD